MHASAVQPCTRKHFIRTSRSPRPLPPPCRLQIIKATPVHQHLSLALPPPSCLLQAQPAPSPSPATTSVSSPSLAPTLLAAALPLPLPALCPRRWVVSPGARDRCSRPWVLAAVELVAVEKRYFARGGRVRSFALAAAAGNVVDCAVGAWLADAFLRCHHRVEWPRTSVYDSAAAHCRGSAKDIQ